MGSESNSGCLEKFLLEFVELGFRIMLGFESLFRVRFKVEVILYSYAGCFKFEFRRLLDIYRSLMRCHRLLGSKRRHTELKEIDFIDTRSLQGKPIFYKGNNHSAL